MPNQAHEARCSPCPARGHFVPEEEGEGGVARMPSSLCRTMSVSGRQNRRLFGPTCRRWGQPGRPRSGTRRSQLCPGSPAEGWDPAPPGESSTARANCGHFSQFLAPEGLPAWRHFSKLLPQPPGPRRDGKEPEALRACQPRAAAGDMAGDAGAGARGPGALTWQLLGGGARGRRCRKRWLGGPGPRAVLFRCRKACPEPHQPVGFAHRTTTGRADVTARSPAA